MVIDGTELSISALSLSAQGCDSSPGPTRWEDITQSISSIGTFVNQTCHSRHVHGLSCLETNWRKDASEQTSRNAKIELLSKNTELVSSALRLRKNQSDQRKNRRPIPSSSKRASNQLAQLSPKKAWLIGLWNDSKVQCWLGRRNGLNNGATRESKGLKEKKKQLLNKDFEA